MNFNKNSKNLIISNHDSRIQSGHNSNNTTNTLTNFSNEEFDMNKFSINYWLSKEKGLNSDKSITDSMLNNEDQRIQRIALRIQSLKQASKSRFEKFFSNNKDKEEKENKTQDLIDNLMKFDKQKKSKSCRNLKRASLEFLPFSEIEGFFRDRIKRKTVSSQAHVKVALSPITGKPYIVISDQLYSNKKLKEIEIIEEPVKYLSENINELDWRKTNTGNVVVSFKSKSRINPYLLHPKVEEDAKESKSSKDIEVDNFEEEDGEIENFQSNDYADENVYNNKSSQCTLRRRNTFLPNPNIILSSLPSLPQTTNDIFLGTNNFFTENLYNKDKMKSNFNKKLKVSSDLVLENDKEDNDFSEKEAESGNDSNPDSEKINNRIFDNNDIRQEEQENVLIWMENSTPKQTYKLDNDINNTTKIEYSNYENKIMNLNINKINDNPNYINKKFLSPLSNVNSIYDYHKKDNLMNNNNSSLSSNFSSKEKISNLKNSYKETKSENDKQKQLKNEKLTGVRMTSSYNKIFLDEIANMLRLSNSPNDNKDPFYLYLTNEHSRKQFISNLNILNDDLIKIINSYILKTLNLLLSNPSGLEMICQYFLVIQQTHLQLVKEFLYELKIEGLVLGHYSSFFITFLRTFQNDQLKMIIFNKVKYEEIIEKMVYDKNGKNLIEYFIEDFFSEENKSRLDPLFYLIETKLLDYSIANFATFIIQKYIRTHKTLYSYEIIKNNIISLGTNRNGVFVIVAALESYPYEKAIVLADIIISNLLIFIKEKYASTLVEFVFKKFPVTIDWFISNKSAYILGKPFKFKY